MTECVFGHSRTESGTCGTGSACGGDDTLPVVVSEGWYRKAGVTDGVTADAFWWASTVAVASRTALTNVVEASATAYVMVANASATCWRVSSAAASLLERFSSCRSVRSATAEHSQRSPIGTRLMAGEPLSDHVHGFTVGADLTAWRSDRVNLGRVEETHWRATAAYGSEGRSFRYTIGRNVVKRIPGGRMGGGRAHCVRRVGVRHGDSGMTGALTSSSVCGLSWRMT